MLVKNLFFVEEKGCIVNYTLNPPNIKETKESIFELIAGLSDTKHNKDKIDQVKRLDQIKQLNNMNKGTMAMKQIAPVPLPAKVQEKYSMFEAYLKFARKQLEIISKYQRVNLNLYSNSGDCCKQEINNLWELSDKEGLMNLN